MWIGSTRQRWRHAGADGRRRRASVHRTSAVALVLLLALAAAPSRADDKDHERARHALQAGQVMPLRTLLDRLAATHPGEVLEVELERDEGRWIYELKLLQPGGELRKLKLDARSGELLQDRLRRPAPRADNREP